MTLAEFLRFWAKTHRANNGSYIDEVLHNITGQKLQNGEVLDEYLCRVAAFLAMRESKQGVVATVVNTTEGNRARMRFEAACAAMVPCVSEILKAHAKLGNDDSAVRIAAVGIAKIAVVHADALLAELDKGAK